MNAIAANLMRKKSYAMLYIVYITFVGIFLLSGGGYQRVKKIKCTRRLHSLTAQLIFYGKQ